MVWDKIRSPRSLAKRMWSSDGQQLAPQDFLALYERVRTATDELIPLWQLGGATNDFLRHHPDAFPAPIDLARFLLSAKHCDAQIVGLKLFTRCEVPAEELLAEAVRALRQKDDSVICGGLHELSIWLDRQLKAWAKLSAAQLDSIEAALRSIRDSKAADYNVESATRQLAYLKELL
jgi:hypothetical protein